VSSSERFAFNFVPDDQRTEFSQDSFTVNHE
jgi:hypothetical protein